MVAKAKALVLAVSVLTLAMGCGGTDQSSQTLSASDVSNLPVGNAVGTSFSGVYVLSDGMITACNCRTGSCATARVSKGNTFTLAETGGALHVTVHSGVNAVDQIYDGGINHGGDFRVGSTYQSGDTISRGLLSGTVIAGVSIDAESQLTVSGKVNGESFDCDLTADLLLSYSTPP